MKLAYITIPLLALELFGCLAIILRLLVIREDSDLARYTGIAVTSYLIGDIITIIGLIIRGPIDNTIEVAITLAIGKWFMVVAIWIGVLIVFRIIKIKNGREEREKKE